MPFSVTRFANSHDLARASCLFIAFAIASYAGFYFFTAPAVVSPAAGIGLAGLIILGIRFWPVIFIATYATYLMVGAPFLFVLCFAIGHTLQAVAGAYLLERLNFDRSFARLRDTLTYIVTAFASATIVPTFGFAGLYLFHASTAAGQTDMFQIFTWNHWWTGMIASLLILTPLIVRWARRPHLRSVPEITETVLAFVVLVTLTFLLTFTEMDEIGNISLVYFVLFPLGWIALRIGPRMMTLALALLAVIAVLGTMMRTNPSELGIELFQTEVFLIIITLIFLILVSVEEERKDADKRLRQNVGDLEHALDRLSDQDQAKSNFLAVLAHELRNPLATILSNVELLRLGSHVREEGLESLSVIEKRLENVTRLLDDLLDVSRISENKIVLRKKPLDLKDAIRGAVENVEHYIRNKRQSLAVDLPPEPLMIKADQTRIEQVFTNLLHNASKFTDRNGSISITAMRKGSSVTVTVKDTGVGIDPEHAAHIFEVFYQGKGRSDEARSGLGIGLALTRDFVSMHRGTIVAKSPGVRKGSEFIVTLPLMRRALPNITVETKKPAVDPDTGLTWEKHLLVVDDNRAAAEGIAKLLRLSGYTVTCAFTGTEVLEHFATSFKPDAIFLDISLPDMSGFEVAKKLRAEHNFEGPIVALSGYGSEEDKQRSYEAGCTHHLTKPVRLAELLETLK